MQILPPLIFQIVGAQVVCEGTNDSSAPANVSTGRNHSNNWNAPDQQTLLPQ